MTKFLCVACGLLFATPTLDHTQPQTTPASLTASALAVGTTAPAFKGLDATGRPVELAQRLKKGPAVLDFYRGQWCPYCSKELSQLRETFQVLTAKGSSDLALYAAPSITGAGWRGRSGSRQLLRLLPETVPQQKQKRPLHCAEGVSCVVRRGIEPLLVE